MDRTNELREAVARHSGSQDASLQAQAGPSRPKQQPSTDEWLSTANITASTLFSLSVFLSGIRKAYLQPSSNRIPGKGQRQRALDFSNGLLGVDTREWTWMSDRERDEVDVQVKSMLRVSMAKIKQLEAVERCLSPTSSPNLRTCAYLFDCQRDKHRPSRCGRAKVPSQQPKQPIGSPSSSSSTTSPPPSPPCRRLSRNSVSSAPWTNTNMPLCSLYLRMLSRI